MSQCTHCENRVESHCIECKQSYCHSCGIISHILAESRKAHTINLVCDECEEEVSVKFCQSCEQYLCNSCDIKIHNKGKRAQHTRENNSSSFCLKNVKSAVYLSFELLLDQFDLEDPSKFEERFTEVNDEIAQSLLLTEDQHFLYFTFFLQEGHPDNSYIQQQKFLTQLKIKNFVFFTEKNILDLDSEKLPELIQSMSFGYNDPQTTIENKKAQNITRIMNQLDSIEYVYLFDSSRNENLANNLKSRNAFENYNFFLNFDKSNPKPFESTIFTGRKKSIRNEFSPKNPLSIFEECPKFNIDDPEQTTKIDFTVRSGNIETQKKQHPKHQSFDEILLNTALDSIQSRKQTMSRNNRGYIKRPVIEFCHPFKEVEINGSPKTSTFIQQELIKFAQEGELLIPKDKFIEKLVKGFQDELSMEDIEDMLTKAEQIGIIHITIRKFLDAPPQTYFGMLFDVLTIESIEWIVRSIKNDMMTPTEKLVLSRIKECYGLKIDPNFWKNVINYLSHQSEKNKKPKWNAYDSKEIFPLRLEKILDPISKTDSIVIYLFNDDWIPEDQGTIEENSLEWKLFLKLIDDFFKEDEHSIDMKNPKGDHDSTFEKGEKKTWSSSVENIMNRSSSKKDKANKINEDIKAIPGGRYGCAQFIKSCGCENLRKLSIGRLTLFVQEAINKGVLRYQRTLLVKNNPNDSVLTQGTDGDVNNSLSQDPVQEGKHKMTKVIQEALIDILEKNPEGVSLAQIPLHLKKVFDSPINFQQLGFPKLKNFLATVNEITTIESTDTNHSYAILKENYKGKKNTRTDNILEGEISNMAPSNNQSSQHNYGGNSKSITSLPPGMQQYDNTMFNGMNSAKSNRKKVSTVDDYLGKIKGLIELILKDNCYGISIQTLYKELCNRLRFEFDTRVFNCANFYDFLLNYAENLIDIEIKKNALIIYPKNFRFGPQTLVSMVGDDQQIMKSSDRTSDRKGLTLNPNAIPFKADNKEDMFGPQVKMEKKTSPFHPGSNSKQPSRDSYYTTPINISPIVFYGTDEDNVNPEQSPTHQRSVSFWNLNFGGNNVLPENGGITVSNLNTAIHSRNGSKAGKPVEESNLEISENLKFIEELLKDGDEYSNFTPERTLETSFGFQSPNLSFTGITAIQPSSNQKDSHWHFKAQSEDFTSKNPMYFSTGGVGHTGHGRNASSVYVGEKPKGKALEQ